MRCPKSGFPLALSLVLLAPATAGFGIPRGADGIDAPRISTGTPILSRFDLPTTKRVAHDTRISGKWYHVVSCPAWSGRYIFHIRWRPGGVLEGSSKGISFGAQGHSSDIVSGTITAGAFEFIERSDKGFIAHYQGSIEPDGSMLSGTYRNTRSGTRCHFVMERFRS